MYKKKNTVVVITEPEQCRQHQQENCPATLISFAVWRSLLRAIFLPFSILIITRHRRSLVLSNWFSVCVCMFVGTECHSYNKINSVCFATLHCTDGESVALPFRQSGNSSFSVADVLLLMFCFISAAIRFQLDINK